MYTYHTWYVWHNLKCYTGYTNGMGQFSRPIRSQMLAMAHRLIMRNQALESKEQLHNDLLQDIPGVGRWAWPKCVHFRAREKNEHWLLRLILEGAASS